VLSLGLVAMFDGGRAKAQSTQALPPEVQAAIQESRKGCESTGGKAILKPGFLTKKDVNGDGVEDYVLDYANFVCGKSEFFFCGTGGCLTQVFASLPDGSFNKVLDRNVRGLRFLHIKGRPAMVLDLHGSACGKAGFEPCRETLYWNGGEFSPANATRAVPITCAGVFNTYATRNGEEISYDRYKGDTNGDTISSIRGEDGDYTCYLLWGRAGHSPFKGYCEDNQRCRVVGTYRKKVGNIYFVDFDLRNVQSLSGGKPQDDRFSASATSVPMQEVGGIYVVPVLVNEAITLKFVVDSGAAHVSIPADVVMTLMRTGTLKNADFMGEQTYVLADGSTVPSQTFRIQSLKVGNKVLENVIGSIASVKGSLLLGQSFLSRFKSWSIDNTMHVLLLEPQ